MVLKQHIHVYIVVTKTNNIDNLFYYYFDLNTQIFIKF